MRRLIISLLAALALAGCREPDRPTSPIASAGLAVDSDPAGARILIDGRDTGLLTPDTVRDLAVDRYTLAVSMDTAGLTFGITAGVRTRAETLTSLTLPLLLGCQTPPCVPDYQSPNDVRFAVSPTGPIMFLQGSGGGALWPAATANSYVSMAMPVLAGILASAPDTVALGPYDYPYTYGRPAPVREEGVDFRRTQSFWIIPQPAVIATIRGIEVREEVLAGTAASDAVVVRLTYTNVSDRPSYQAVDSVGVAGVAYESVWLGMALDGDVGSSEDDLVSYFPDMDMAVLYDADFRESSFTAEWGDRPGLIGLRVLEKPAGTTVALNGWPRPRDWQAEGLRPTSQSPGYPERTGFGWLSATQSALPNHPDPRIGYAPTDRNDYRISAAAGPVTLRPGQSASVTLAIVFGAPDAGTYTAGVLVPSGDPLDTSRQLYRVGATLRANALEAEALAGGQ